MGGLLEQIKRRRLALSLKQHDMLMRIGISRQQYQRLESKGNPCLDTLELIAKGLESELLLIPQEKLNAVNAILDEDSKQADASGQSTPKPSQSLSDNPWQGLLGDNE